MTEEMDIIVLNDGEKDVEMRVEATLGVEDMEYAILESVEAGEIYIFRYREEGDEVVFEPIEDDDEFDAVVDAYEELIAEDGDEA